LVILDFETTASDTTHFREFGRFSSWDLQEQAVEQAGLLGKLQFVLFHPRAAYQTYGMHWLREDDVLRAVEGGHPNMETLPARNQAGLKEQGLEVCRRRLAECYIQDIYYNNHRGSDPRMQNSSVETFSESCPKGS
jgi:hypothetical protein